uniref:STAS domain-containing protein n=1 Tax=Ningiella ruwaisensis TaxID=2364274 RepID=UPI0014467EAA|nr:STAS domain-containing protein [Ningiella ruwaisensis]
MQLSFSDKDQALIKLKGELTLDTLSQNLIAMLSNKDCTTIDKAKKVDISLNQVERVDTAGLAWLINAVRDFNKRDVRVCFLHIPQKLSDLAKLSNAEALLSTSE